jgi:hypothetical protein
MANPLGGGVTRSASMDRKAAYVTLIIALGYAPVHAQHVPTAPSQKDVYCAGILTTEAPPSGFYVISGPESSTRVTYQQGDVVFINHGSAQGVKVGDEFQVTRAVKDPIESEWFTGQHALVRAMGQAYRDVGHLRVLNVQPNTAVAEVVSSCDLMQRGDIVQPFVERPAPPYKAEQKFDRFAPASGKAMAMIVENNSFGQVVGAGSMVYVNLGAAQGVKIGDYFRIFRYQGESKERVYQTAETAYKVYGYGATPVPYKWSDLPRDVLGEGIVVRVGPNASSVLITVSQREIYMGDYTELE